MSRAAEGGKKTTLIFRTTRLCAAKSVMNMSFLFCLKANAFKKAFPLSFKEHRDDHSAYILDNEVVRLNWRV